MILYADNDSQLSSFKPASVACNELLILTKFGLFQGHLIYVCASQLKNHFAIGLHSLEESGWHKLLLFFFLNFTTFLVFFFLIDQSWVGGAEKDA